MSEEEVLRIVEELRVQVEVNRRLVKELMEAWVRLAELKQ